MLGLLLAAGLVPSAFAGEIGRAPLNPAFVEYMEEVAAASELKTDGVKENALGWKPSPVDLSHLRDEPVVLTKGAKTFAASFDLRTEGKLTSVKNQNPYGTCWAHATYASMESALLPGETNDFSENHLVNLHGFDWGFDDGGNGVVSMAYLTRWEGPVNEADDPYPDEGGSTGAEPVRRHVQEVLLIPAKSGPTNNDAIKQALQDYGAVYVNYYHHDSYYHSTNASYYYAGGSNGNHAVAIVGWNDNYPSNQFNSVAPGNGAYIVKNSWGTGWGESGYFYVSYHDTVFAYDELFVFHDAGSTSNYSRVYDYDPLGWVNSIGTGSGTTFWGANLFTAEADEDLAAVGFYAVSADTDYEIYIYKGITAGAPRSGMLAASESGTGLAAGYGTIALSTNVGLTNGQRFSIVLKLTTPDTTYPQAFEYALAGYSSAAGASAGQSYYSSSGSSWTDLTTFESTANLCIKGYAASAEAPPSAPASIWASATNAAGFTAAWSGVAEAESYRLDVATDSGFTGGGGAGRMLLASNAATSPSLIAGDWSGTDLGGTTYVIMTQATSEVESPAFSTVGFTNLTVDFRARTYGGTTKSNITISISTNNGSTWSVAGVVNPLSGSTWSTIPTLTNTVDLGHAETRVRWQTLDAGA
ncbi:MAG: hypothetical protein GX548_12320, partial [Lentisphaerae bacterium]|nr:hypothetical protein [Lentisphaerota bacterium]